MAREIELEGTVTKLDWRNPHILLTLEVRDGAGNPFAHEIEVFAVSQVRALGLRREVIEPGKHVVVRARPNRSGPGARALGLDVTADDGTVYPLSTEPRLAIRPPVPPAATLAGQWVPSVESFNAFVDSARSPLPLTEAGRAAQEEMVRTWMVAGVASAGICEPFPPMQLSVNPDMRTIEVSDASVVIRYEAQGMNQQRIIHMDRGEHPADLAPSLLGHSIGRWEGDALVIDTVGMTPHRLGIVVVPSTPRTHLIERLTLAEDGRQLQYTFTAEDPVHLERPVSFTFAWDHRPDLPPSSDACDPDNARQALER